MNPPSNWHPSHRHNYALNGYRWHPYCRTATPGVTKILAKRRPWLVNDVGHMVTVTLARRQMSFAGSPMPFARNPDPFTPFQGTSCERRIVQPRHALSQCFDLARFEANLWHGAISRPQAGPMPLARLPGAAQHRIPVRISHETAGRLADQWIP